MFLFNHLMTVVAPHSENLLICFQGKRSCCNIGIWPWKTIRYFVAIYCLFFLILRIYDTFNNNGPAIISWSDLNAPRRKLLLLMVAHSIRLLSISFPEFRK